MTNNKIVILTGGTGGHVIPALNFGNYLISKGYNCTLLLDKRGIKYASNFKGKKIIINSAHFSGNYLFIINSAFILLYGLFQSFFHLFVMRPKHCIAFGSYATFMPLIAATVLRIFGFTTIHLHEQNSIIGKVNLFYLPFAKNLFSNFKYMRNLKLNYQRKNIVSGLPNNAKNFYQKRFDKKYNGKKIKIFIYGGSQGSLNLNSAVIRLIEELPNSYYNKIYITFQCPELQIRSIEKILKKLKIEHKLQSYFENIYEVLNLSDLVIARSGAGTINDIIISQVPSIVVPLPHSIYNHQYENGKYLEENNACILIQEKEIYLKKTYIKFKELIDNKEKRSILINNLQSIKVLDANKIMLKKIFK